MIFLAIALKSAGCVLIVLLFWAIYMASQGIK